MRAYPRRGTDMRDETAGERCRVVPATPSLSALASCGRRSWERVARRVKRSAERTNASAGFSAQRIHHNARWSAVEDGMATRPMTRGVPLHTSPLTDRFAAAVDVEAETKARPPDEPCKCGRHMLQPWWAAVIDAGNEGTDYKRHSREECLTQTERNARHAKCPRYTPACACLVPVPVFYVCCGYWCRECDGKCRS